MAGAVRRVGVAAPGRAAPFTVMTEHAQTTLHRLAVAMNASGVAYVMGVVNAALVAVTAFGVNITVEQQAAVVLVANAVLILAVYLLSALANGKETE
jgi:hypothetical protein